MSVATTAAGAAVRHANTETGSLLLAAAFAFALAYGLIYFRRPPSPVRTIVKTCAVTALAGVSLVNAAPWPLTLALVFCAVGDAFLAGDPKRWLPPGLASFLAGHLTYVATFVTMILSARNGFAAAGGLPIVNLAVMAVAVLIGGGMLAWLWKDLGHLRWAVAAYVAAILAMVCTSLALPRLLDGAQYGALLFFASDGVLSAQLFKQRFTGLLGQWVVWGCYFLGQVLIVMAFSPLTF